MAIYHCSTKSLGRRAGRSAVAAAAYRTASRLEDERTGQVHDYGRRSGVVATELVLPEGAPAMTRNELWNAAETAERRKDSRTAREWVLALPDELSREQRQKLVRDFACDLSARYGVAVDVAIHAPDREGDQRNHHAHLLATTRRVGPDGLGPKTEIELSDKTRAQRGLGQVRHEVVSVREHWAALVNHHLERAGLAARVDHRSLAAQGLDRAPTVHLGPTATEMERRARRSDRGDLNRATRAENQERAEATRQLHALRAVRRELAERLVESARAQRLAPLADSGRKAPAPPSPAAPPLSGAQLVAHWDARIREQAGEIRTRAERATARLGASLRRLEAEHRVWQGQEPRGLSRLLGGRLEAWRREGARRQQRRSCLEGRLEQVQPYRERSTLGGGYTSKADELAQRKLRLKQPELAARVDAARQLERKRRLDRLEQARRSRSKGHGPRGRGPGSS